MLPLGKFIEDGFKIPIDVGTDAKSNSPDNMLPLGKFIEDGFKIEMSDTALKITHPSDVQKI